MVQRCGIKCISYLKKSKAQAANSWDLGILVVGLLSVITQVLLVRKQYCEHLNQQTHHEYSFNT